MARSVVKLQGKEIELFHANYEFMWKKLNTAPYYVSGFGEMPDWIKEEWTLPSYVNLSKCMNPNFVPSMNIVNKIVQFYNANIIPKTDSYQFLHEKLEENTGKMNLVSEDNIKKYCGLYYSYYFSGIENERQIYGSIIKLSENHGEMTAIMITGFMSDEDIRGKKVKDLFSSKEVSFDEYKEFRSSLPLARRRTVMYRGKASLAPGLITIQLQAVDVEGSFITFRAPVKTNSEEEYLGSMGILSMIDGDYNIQILKMGLERADNKELTPILLSNEKLPEMLSIKKTPNEHIHLTMSDNKIWNDYILLNSEG